jgi:PAS domain-containing protein
LHIASPSIFEHTRDAVLVLDRELRVVEMNRASVGLFGAREALVGSPVSQVLPSWRLPEIPACGTPPETELTWKSPQDASRPVSPRGGRCC